MTNSGDFPKINGDVFYAPDANKQLGMFVGQEQLKISATQADASATYGTNRQYHLIQNSGPNIVYINFDATATTSSFQLNPNKYIEVYGVSNTIHAICNTGLTATVRIWGMNGTADSPNISVGQISATNTNSSLTLATNAVWCLIENVGPKFAYIAINGAATTNNFQIGLGIMLTFMINTMTTLQAITSGSDTTTLCVISSPLI